MARTTTRPAQAKASQEDPENLKAYGLACPQMSARSFRVSAKEPEPDLTEMLRPIWLHYLNKSRRPSPGSLPGRGH